MKKILRNILKRFLPRLPLLTSADLLKIFSITAIALSLSACRFRELPEWTPYATFPKRNAKIKCVLADKKKMIFDCEDVFTPLDDSLEGAFCTPQEQIGPLTGWMADAIKKIETGK